MTLESTFLLLFVVAMAVAIVVRHLRLPYTVGLVLAGLVLGWAQLLPAPELNKSLLFSIFLPGLIFEAAFHIDAEELWRNRITISSLAVPGVIASMIVIAVVAAPLASAYHFIPGFTWKHALVFGALISATDPVAVLSVFRSSKIPRRLSVLLEGESLLNDGTGIVFFTLSLSIVAGTVVTPRALALQFVTVVGMGLAIGLVVGFAVSTVLRRIDDPMIEISLTTIAAYGAFVAAENLGYSGVIATVASGIVCGSYGARSGMSPSSRVAAETFWDYVAFALNSVVFLLIGLEVPLRNLLNSWPQIVTAYFIVTLARALVINIAWRLVGVTRERFPWRWSVVLIWGGLRGALPMVLALGLPTGFPFREQIVSTTFGVVILSILGHGLTMSPLLRWLGIMHAYNERTNYDVLRGELRATNVAIEDIEQLDHYHALPPSALKQIKDEYRKRAEDTRDELTRLTNEHGHLGDQETYQARRRLLLVEKRFVVEAYRRGLWSAEAQDRLLANIDARLLELEASAFVEIGSRSERNRDERNSQK